MSRSVDGDPLTPAQAGVQKSQIAALGPRFRGDERSLRCQLICVDPAQAHEFWPHVASLIRAAMEKGRLSSYADVEHAVRNGHALLWLAWNGETVKAAAATESPAPTARRSAPLSPAAATTARNGSISSKGSRPTAGRKAAPPCASTAAAAGSSSCRSTAPRACCWKRNSLEALSCPGRSAATQISLRNLRTLDCVVMRCRPGTVSVRDGPGSAMQRSAIGSRCIASGTRERD
jgi:hypothetical protein